MSYQFSIILLLFASTLHAQFFTTDTVKVEEVHVVTTRKLQPVGFTAKRIDPLLIAENSQSDLADILQGEAALNIRKYGQGKLASVNMRGASVAHTQVVWNGMHVNSPMTGQTDFSLIPVVAADEITLIPSSIAMGSNPGSLGGSVIINGKPNWKNNWKTVAPIEVGQYAYLRAGATAMGGNTKFQNKTSVYYQTADFTNLQSVTGQTGSKYTTKGVLQEIYLKPGATNSFSVKLWAQQRNMVLNADTNKYEEQNDGFVNSVAEWSHYTNYGKLNVLSSFGLNQLAYNANASNIVSRNHTYNLQNSLSFTSGDSGWLKFHAGIRHYYYGVNSNNYDGLIKLNTYSVFAGANAQANKKVLVFVSVKQEFHPSYSLPILPSVGANWKLNELFSVKIGASANSKTPNLNDLYWNLGGNPDLLPEKGKSVETGLVFSKIMAKSHVSSEFTAYHNASENRILWLPNGSLWTPVNVQQVRSRGIEWSGKLSLKIVNQTIFAGANYAFTQAVNLQPISGNERTKGKQLIFVPKHKAGGSVGFRKGKTVLKISQHYEGLRYVSNDNSASLPACFLTDFSVLRKFELFKIAGNFGLTVDNIFNKQYEQVPGHPMVGRMVLVKLKMGGRS